MDAEITFIGAVDMQVCVPADWNDKLVKDFADANNPSGVIDGWQIRKEGSKFLNGDPERRPCESRDGFVHVMLDVLVNDVKELMK